MKSGLIRIFSEGGGGSNCLKFLYFCVHAGSFSAADTQSTILLHNWNQ